MAINPKNLQKQQDKLQRLGLKKEDLEEKFILSSGPGGQKTNKTSSAVYLKHLPTGIQVKASADRSREINRYLAREKLIEAFQNQVLNLKTKKQKQLAKKKKQKKRRRRKTLEKYSNLKNSTHEKK